MSIKTDRITTLNHLMNKNKLDTYNHYFDNVLLAKNTVSRLGNKDQNLQDQIFRKNRLTKEEKNTLNNTENKKYQEYTKVLTKWELQKFFNQDYLDKEYNRYEQIVDNFKSKIFTIEKKYKKVVIGKKRIKILVSYNKYKSTLLGKYIEIYIKNYFYNSKYYKELLEKIILKLKEKSNFLDTYQDRINNLIETIMKRIKTNKPIIYTTPSIIKSGDSGLGINDFRIAKDENNKKYKYFYSLDTYDLNGKKEIINIPLSYNQNYHKDFLLYRYSSDKNKHQKGKNKNLKDNSEKVVKKEKIKKPKIVKTRYKNTIVESKIISLFEKEHYISFSKNSNRLNISLTKEYVEEFKENYVSIKKENLVGIDIGGKLDNSIVDSNQNIIKFDFLKKIIKDLKIIDKIENKEEKNKKITKISRVLESNLNLLIKQYLDYCQLNGIKHISMEKLDMWNMKGKSKEEGQKHNRIFRLIRSRGLVNLFRKQRRNRQIYIHTIPSYYTSKLCNCCKSHIIENNNQDKKNRLLSCPNCSTTIDRDFNRAKNMSYILERFSKKLCKLDNNYYEYNREKYLKKEYVKNTLLGIKTNKDIELLSR